MGGGGREGKERGKRDRQTERENFRLQLLSQKETILYFTENKNKSMQ